MSVTAEIMEIMSKSFKPENAKGEHLVYQFDITDADTFYVSIDDGECDIKPDAHENPTVTLILESTTMLKLMSGKTSGTSAFMMGKIKATGELMHGFKLNKLFSIK